MVVLFEIIHIFFLWSSVTTTVAVVVVSGEYAFASNSFRLDEFVYSFFFIGERRSSMAFRRIFIVLCSSVKLDFGVEWTPNSRTSETINEKLVYIFKQVIGKWFGREREQIDDVCD